MNQKSETLQKALTKFIISILLLIALLKMPYGYYQVMRIAVSGLFGWLTYACWKDNKVVQAIICCFGVVLFQPIVKLAFHKKEWQLIDFWVAIALGVWIVGEVILLFRKRLRN